MATAAHAALHKFNILPSEFLKLSREDKAFIIASINIAAEKEAEEMRKMKSSSRKKK